MNREEKCKLQRPHGEKPVLPFGADNDSSLLLPISLHVHFLPKLNHHKGKQTKE